MLDKNNSLLTAISDEECATVSGGDIVTGITGSNNQFTIGADGSLQLNLNVSGNFTGTAFTSSGIISFSPTALATVQGSASTADNSQSPVSYSFLNLIPR